MESLPDVARRILDRHPAPALPFRALHRRVAAARAGPTPTRRFLLARIRSQRHRFRILDPWRGPWRTLAGGAGAPASDAPVRRALRDVGLVFDPWVLAADREGVPRRSSSVTDGDRLRTTLVHLGREIDGDSPAALARWILLLREERALRRRRSTG